MGLLSIFQRNRQAAARPANPANPSRGGKSPARQAPQAKVQSPVDSAEAMRDVRARARTRLMGATVLLLIGVIGFPLLFETQPRPIPVDLPIEIPARNAPAGADASSHAGTRSVAGLAAPGAAASTPAGRIPESVSYDSRNSAAASAPEAASTPAPHRSAFASLAAALTSSPARTNELPASVPPSASAALAQTRAAARPPKASAATTTAPPVAAASRPSPAAILADAPAPKPSDAAGGGRFVVQVGAFLEDAKVRETRAKVEKLGMKTYTQPVETPTGKRTRVRLGPYATKADADRIAAKLKSDGLQAVVLSL